MEFNEPPFFTGSAGEQGWCKPYIPVEKYRNGYDNVNHGE
jgi:hypothetical protein